jgi:hypothetical protein
MKLSTLSSLGLSTLVLGLVQTPAVAINIDFFGEGDQYLQVINDPNAPPNPFDDDVVVNLTDTYLDPESTTGTLGGTRYISIEIVGSRTVDSDRSANLDINIEGQNASFSSNSEIQAEATFKWDNNGNGLRGIDDGIDGIDGIDLTENNTQNSLKLDISFLSLEESVSENPILPELTFTIEDYNDGIQNISQKITKPGVVYFNYGNKNNRTADFTDVKAITLKTTETTYGQNMTFDFLATAEQPVPFEFSPSLGIILSSGFFGFHALKKRWKNNSSDKLIS